VFDVHVVQEPREVLHRAFALAGERRHEYATLEHLLLAMTEDEDATPVLKACGVDIDRLRMTSNRSSTTA
jgi:ATP-dependent Clp protease ATP-binding subunit ClpA